MGIFGRIWRVIKGWLLIGVEKAEDPSIILAEAQESMRRELDKAKESAVQAIAARNQLRGVLQDQENSAANLEAQARAALKQGNEDLARRLLMEKATFDQNIEGLKVQLAQAEQASETVKENIKRLEAHVRQRAAQRLALQAGWQQAKIQEQLNKALSGISMEGHDEAFNRAEGRIRELKAKADARVELAQGGLHSEIAKLENSVANDKASLQLEAMKAEMGMSSAQQDDDLARLKAEIAADKKQEQPVVRNIEV